MCVTQACEHDIGRSVKAWWWKEGWMILTKILGSKYANEGFRRTSLYYNGFIKFNLKQDYRKLSYK